jgi:hypothetical protein
LARRLNEGSSFEFGPIKLGELRRELDSVHQGLNQLNDNVGMLFLSTMSQIMYENLRKIESGHFGSYEKSIPFSRELHYLRMIGYIEVDSIMSIPAEGTNLPDYVKITETGKEYIRLRTEMENRKSSQRHLQTTTH